MNRFITLREVCEKLEISRRTIQGYEKAGLVTPSGRNKYGHLLYDEHALQEIAEIRLYQKLGFKVKEINRVRQGSSQQIQQELEGKVIGLKKERREIEALIHQAEELMRSIEKRKDHETKNEK